MTVMKRKWTYQEKYLLLYLTLIANKYTLYTLFLSFGENFRRGKVTKFFKSDENFPRRKVSPTKFSPIRYLF